MNRTTPIVLLVLVVLAGTYVVVFEMRRLPDAEQIEVQSRLFGLRAAAVESAREMTVARAGSSVTLAKGPDGAWRLTTPVEALARQDVAAEVVREVLLVRRTGGEIPKEQWAAKGLAAYGLETPRVSATVRAGEGAGAREFILLLGSEDPTKQYVYAKSSRDAAIALVDRWVAERLALGANDFRETRFIRFDMNRLTGLRLRSLRAEVDLVKREGAWEATTPYADRVDSLQMEDLLRALGEIEAKSFPAEVAGNLAPFGLDRPRVEAVLTRDDNSTITILIGGACKDPVGTVYAKLANEPPIYAVDESVVGKLTFAPEFLRSRRLAMVGASGVSGFAVERPGAKLVVKKEGAQWKIVEPAPLDADADAVDDFLRAVSNLKVLRFADDAPDDAAVARCGLDEKSRATLTVRQPGKPEIVFDVGRVDAAQKDLYVRRRGAPGIITVAESFAARMTASPLDFRARKLAAAGRYDVRKLVVRRPEGAVTIEKGVDGKWRLTAPVAGPADEINVGAILDDFHELTAVRFLAEKAGNLAEFALDKPSFDLTAEMTPGKDKPAETKTLRIGKDLGDGSFAAKLGDGDLVFAVSGEFVQRLRAEFRRREIWRLDAAQISGATWRYGAEKVVVRRDENAWTLVEPAGRALEPGAFEAIIAAAAYLRVERFEPYTKDNLATLGLATPRATLTITAEGRDYILFVGADKDAASVYACVSTEDVVFALPKSAAEPLLKSPLASARPPALLTPLGK